MKKLTSILTAIALTFSLVLTGCGSNETTLSGTSEDVYGQVTAIDGKVVSVDVISLSQGMGGDQAQGGDQSNVPEMPSGDQTQGSGDQADVPEMPSGDQSQGGQSSDMSQAQAPGQAGGGQSSDNSGSTPPEIPSGDSAGAQAGASDNGNVPEMPSGDSAGGQAGAGDNGNVPEMPSGDSNGQGGGMGQAGGGMGQGASNYTTTGDSGTVTINDTSKLYKIDNGSEVSATLDDITTDTFLKITFDDSGKIEKIVVGSISDFAGSTGGGMGDQNSGAPTSYDAVYTYSEDTTVTGETLTSTGTDENVVWVSGGTTTLDNVTVNRTSSDSTGGDNSSFYGVGAALLATNGTLNVTNSTITTDAAGGTGVFAYGTGVVNVSDTTISTAQNTSGGIHVAGGGTLYATNVTATTQGASSAAIRSDKGGGTMRVNGGTYTSNGSGSPAIYCTADIAVENANLEATGSEALCLEGNNSVKLYNCNLTGNMPDDDQNDSTWTVILYQSQSGDAESGSGSFEMQGGTLTSKNGGLFYTTNTTSHFVLDNVTINQTDDDYLLACLGNNNSRGWGSSGSNGAECTFTAIDQQLSGKILWDSISKLDFYLTNGSTLTGSVVQDDTYAAGGTGGHSNLYIESGSKWVVNGNSTLTNLYNAGTIVDASGNTVSIVGTDGTVYVQGSSSYQVTVSSYSTTVDLSGADSITSSSELGFK